MIKTQSWILEVAVLKANFHIFVGTLAYFNRCSLCRVTQFDSFHGLNLGCHGSHSLEARFYPASLLLIKYPLFSQEVMLGLFYPLSVLQNFVYYSGPEFARLSPLLESD